jgi:hypothetical protein
VILPQGRTAALVKTLMSTAAKAVASDTSLLILILDAGLHSLYDSLLSAMAAAAKLSFAEVVDTVSPSPSPAAGKPPGASIELSSSGC